MHIKLNNPPDSFNRVEAIEFTYRSTPAQKSKNTLTIRAKKYKIDSDGAFAYSDEPPFEIFIKDTDAFMNPFADDHIVKQAFGACMYMTSFFLNSEKGQDTEVVV